MFFAMWAERSGKETPGESLSDGETRLDLLTTVRSGILQCLGALDGTHVEIKRPSVRSRDYRNKKGTYSLNVQAVCDYKSRFLDVVIKLPGSIEDDHVFAHSHVHQYLRTGQVPAMERRIVEDEEPVPIFLLGDPAYPLLPHLMKEHPDGGSTAAEQSVGLSLRTAHRVVEVAFGQLKARFSRMRPMDTNLKDLPHVIFACFVLHNYCARSLWTKSKWFVPFRGAKTVSPRPKEPDRQ